MSDFPRVNVEGDVEGGWIVGIHDGDAYRVHHPEATDAADARAKAWLEHFGSAEPAPAAPVEPVEATEPETPAA